MNRTRLAVAMLAASALAAVALGQNADKNSAGPTKNDYRLRVVEPAEGGVITGSTVRVVVNTQIPSEAGDTRRDVNSMPRPDVDVFLDGDLKGTMRDAENVLEIESVTVGPHELVLLAKNRANEIIDRKAIGFTSTATAAAAASSGSSSDGAWALAQPATTSSDAALTRDVPPPAPKPAPVVAERSTSYSDTSSAPAPTTMVAQASPRPQAPPRTLPETASSDPALVLAGAGLLLAGLLARRRV